MYDKVNNRVWNIQLHSVSQCDTVIGSIKKLTSLDSGRYIFSGRTTLTGCLGNKGLSDHEEKYRGYELDLLGKVKNPHGRGYKSTMG